MHLAIKKCQFFASYFKVITKKKNIAILHLKNGGGCVSIVSVAKTIVLKWWTNMKDNKFLMVKMSVLPAVFSGVMKAKELLASGEAATAAQAVRMAGISRSAFYKYKDCVFDIGEGAGGRIVNLNAVLKDKAGVLSSFISVLYQSGMNIVTVNQGIPVNGAAQVSVSVKIDEEGADIDRIINDLSQLYGVASVGLVLGE